MLKFSKLSPKRNPLELLRKTKFSAKFEIKHGTSELPHFTDRLGLVVIRLDDVEQRDVEDHLVAVVPGVQRPLPGVVVQHGDVKVLVVERYVGVLVRGGLGGVRVVHLGARHV